MSSNDFCIICLEEGGGSRKLLQNWPCPCKYAYHVDCMNRWNVTHGYACIVCRTYQPPYSIQTLLYTKIVVWVFVGCFLYGIGCVLYALYVELGRTTHLFL